jgi:hypothetical protein
MARVRTRGDSKVSKRKIAGPKAPKSKKARTAGAKKGRSKNVRATGAATARTPAAFHEQAATAGAEHPTSAGEPFAGVGSTAGASPRALMELSGLNTASSEGLGGAILDLVGEGKLTVAHALAAWTHEQDRLANRAWRRPGGLQRMGGV